MGKMKLPVCSVCKTMFNEEDRVPLMLQCGHSFCKECLVRMFADSTEHTLLCPRCRQPSRVGNSVEALRKNFTMLSVIQQAPQERQSDQDTEDEDDDMDSGVDTYLDRSFSSHSWSSGCSGISLEMSSQNLRYTKRLGSGSLPGQEVFAATLVGPSGCRHKVAVKSFDMFPGLDVGRVRALVDELHRAAMWCQNVCTVYGACEREGKLCIVMDRYQCSVQDMMQQNEGRLTLEQILRYGADISRGVAELQAAGVVCMNLKPSNFLVDAKGRAVIADYGIAEALKRPNCKGASRGDDGTKKLHFCADCSMLNPCYMAPEAWEPLRKSTINLFWEDANGISVESDAWSFGCSLVEMCTGIKPWFGYTQDEIYKAVVKAKRLPPQYVGVVGGGIPRELWKMIGECLNFKPSKRPAFHSMLALFLRHLREMPLSPPASPDNDPVKVSDVGTEPSPSSTLAFSETSQTHLRLQHMVLEGDSDGIRELLNKYSGSVNSLLEAHNSDGQAALHIAAVRGDCAVLELLCSFPEVDMEILDKDGDTPIVYGIMSGKPEVLQLLIRKGANVNARLREGLGPAVVHFCTKYGQPNCMRELLLAGADPNVADDEGETPLHQAIERRNIECAVVILENGGCKSMATVNAKEFSPLHICVLTGNVPIMKRWGELASREDIDNAIEVPSQMGRPLFMSSTLKKIHEQEAKELVKILLHLGADGTAVDPQSGHTPLHVAASRDNAQMVQIILEAGVNVDVRNVHNSTPLHVALAKGSKSCVQMLLERGANCNLQDDEGNTAFHIAAEMAKMVREDLDWIAVMLRRNDAATDVKNHSCKTLRDLLEALPREWISEDLMDALGEKGIHLSPTVFEVGDWVKFRRTVTSPRYGWGGAKRWSVGFVQNIIDGSTLLVSFCSGEAKALVEEVVKVIPLDRGQYVRLKSDVKQPRFGWRGQNRDSIGTVLCVDDDGILRVGFPGASRGWKADPAEMERVEEFKVGDWVRIRPTLTAAKHGLGPVTPGSIGVVHSIRPDRSLLLDFSYLKNPWHCEPEEVERVDPFKVGDRICVKRSVAEPKYGWCGETHHSVGEITEVGADGLLLVYVPGRSTCWQADPSDMEKVQDFKVGDWVRIKASVCSPKYGWDDVNRSSVGVVFSLEEGDMGIGFCHRSKPFMCSITDVEAVIPFEVGQEVHIAPSVTEPRLGWCGENSASRGRIFRIDMDGTLNVKVANRSSMWRVAPGDAERLSGFDVGDWVRLKLPPGLKPSYDWLGSSKESVAVVHSIIDSGYLELAGCFRSGRWMAHYTELEKAQSLRVGQHVRFRQGITEPRWGWRGCCSDSRGVIVGVHADGEVRVAFPGLRAPWRGDPADLEREEMFDVGDWVKVKEDLAEPKYGWKGARPGSLGVVQGIGYDNAGDFDERAVLVGLCSEQEHWVGQPFELEKVKPFCVSQQIRVKATVSQPRFGWSGHDHSTTATITLIDADGRLRAYSELQKSWLLDPAEVELYEEQPICIGDWVKVKPSVPTPTHQWGEVTHRSIGVVHKIDDVGDLRVAFCMQDRLWVCKPSEMERVEAFKIGDKVQVKVAARTGWANAAAARGIVCGVDADGKVRIQFDRCEAGIWVGDPADVELDLFEDQGCLESC